MARVPNVSEPALDFAFIDHLAGFASPAIVAPNWTVRVETHFLGGLAHFHRWEIADIGLLIYVRLGGTVVARKVALLQSKRLYPTVGEVEALGEDDFSIGFARFLPSAELGVRPPTEATFEFSVDSRYKSLRYEDKQVKAIVAYQRQNEIPVHYLLYNPWQVPSRTELPLTSSPRLVGTNSVGARVLGFDTLHGSRGRMKRNSCPTLGELAGLVGGGAHEYGWRLEHFVADLVLACREGKLFESDSESGVYNLFNRRSGPISAAIAVSIDGPLTRST